MTIQEIIAKVDDLMPNQYSDEQKTGWLSTLDGKIFHEVVMTHVCGYPYFDEYDSVDRELIVQPPYADDLYTNYIMSRIAAANNETAKYEQYSAMFNQAFSEFSGWYNRTHMPIQRGRWRL